jgi:hypothetical protein
MSYELSIEVSAAALVHIFIISAIPWPTLRPLVFTRNIR